MRKKQLLARISELEKQLAKKDRASAMIEEAALPKCKSQACANCSHVVFKMIPEFGISIILGCGKDLACPDYKERVGRPSVDETLKILSRQGLQ